MTILKITQKDIGNLLFHLSSTHFIKTLYLLLWYQKCEWLPLLRDQRSESQGKMAFSTEWTAIVSYQRQVTTYWTLSIKINNNIHKFFNWKWWITAAMSTESNWQIITSICWYNKKKWQRWPMPSRMRAIQAELRCQTSRNWSCTTKFWEHQREKTINWASWKMKCSNNGLQFYKRNMKIWISTTFTAKRRWSSVANKIFLLIRNSSRMKNDSRAILSMPRCPAARASGHAAELRGQAVPWQRHILEGSTTRQKIAIERPKYSKASQRQATWKRNALSATKLKERMKMKNE